MRVALTSLAMEDCYNPHHQNCWATDEPSLDTGLTGDAEFIIPDPIHKHLESSNTIIRPLSLTSPLDNQLILWMGFGPIGHRGYKLSDLHPSTRLLQCPISSTVMFHSD